MSSSSLISQPWVSGSSWPGISSVLDSSGSPSSVSSAWVTVWSGMRTPIVCFFGCSSRDGTSRVAGRMNVYGPGVQALTSRNTALLTWASCPSWEKSRQVSVKWWCLSSWRIARIRPRASRLPIWAPRA